MTLVAQQRSERHEGFVGRGAELARFTEVVARRHRGRVHIIWGVGGIGKTSLLLEIARLGPAGDAVYLDARELEARPDALEVASRHRTLVLLDEWDALASLDGWLRQTFLPALPDDVVLVVAQRDPPGPAWRSLAGWGTLVCATELRRLSDGESRCMLERLGVPDARLDEMVAFASGHPLALRLVAETLARAPDQRFDSGASEVVQTLVHVLLSGVAGAAERATLEIAAVVRTVTEPLIAALLPGADACGLFRWLASLAVVVPGAAGLQLHDLVREVIGADLRWRNLDRWNDLVARAAVHLRDAARRATDDARLRLGFELLFLIRQAGWLSPAGNWSDASRPNVELAQPIDHPALVALVAVKEGEDSAALAAEWMRRRPERVYKFVRDGDPAPAGLTLALAFDDDSGPALAWDPGAAAAWRAITALGPLRRGESAILCRFYMDRELYQLPSAVFVAHLATFNALQLTQPGIRYGLYVVADPAFWEPLFKPLELAPVAEAEFSVGGRRYGMFLNDFRRTTPDEYFRRSFAVLAGARRPPLRRASDPLERLDRAAFGRAAHRALKGLRDDEALAANPLSASRLAWVRSLADGADARARALREAVLDAVDALAAAPNGEALREIARRTYVDARPGQKEVAYDLHLSWSSYRRRLGEAVERVVDRLWRDEIA